MKKILITGLGLAVVLACSVLSMADEHGAAPSAGSAEFERMKTLVGDWEGTAVSGMHGEQPARVEYRLTSGGSALVETLFPGTDHEMVSVYHDRGGRLSLTHYCMLNNQPELDVQESAPERLVLTLAERSAIDSAVEPHMHSLTLGFTDADHMVQEWTFFENGVAKDSTKILLSRVGAPSTTLD